MKYRGVNWRFLFGVLLTCSVVGCGGTDSGGGSIGATGGADVGVEPVESVQSVGLESSLVSESAQGAVAGAVPFAFASMYASSGIDFVQESGDSKAKPFPAANGTGCGLLDVDLDGHLDVYFANGAEFPLSDQQPGPWDRLYRSVGGWKFAEITGVAGIGEPGYSCGVAAGDVDSDGFADLYVTRYGRNLLYRNLGDGTFEECGEIWGAADGGWGTSAAILDANQDGLADVYVCNYGVWTWETNPFCGDEGRQIRMFCSPRHVAPQADVLLVNTGEGFVNRLEDLGAARDPGRGQGVLAGDFDGDGLTDLYVANDIHPNFLLMNSGRGFEELGEASGTAFDHLGQAQAGMGLAVADVEGDGRFEIFVTNYQNEHNALYLNLGERTFLEAGLQRIPEGSMPWVGWGALLADFDLDGQSDLMVTNGHTDNNLAELGKEGDYLQPPGLWKNEGGSFKLAGGAGAYFAARHCGRGLAGGDIDSDGDTDVVVCHQDAAPELLRNDSPGDNNFEPLTVRLIGIRGLRDVVGATAVLEEGSGEGVRRQWEQLYGGGSYASASERRLRFVRRVGGAKVRLRIRWPGGEESVLEDLPAGRMYSIVQGQEAGAAPRVIVVD